MPARFWWPSASLAAIHDLTIAGAGLLAVGLVALSPACTGCGDARCSVRAMGDPLV
jgi:hypothetical protein